MVTFESEVVSLTTGSIKCINTLIGGWTAPTHLSLLSNTFDGRGWLLHSENGTVKRREPTAIAVICQSTHLIVLCTFITNYFVIHFDIPMEKSAWDRQTKYKAGFSFEYTLDTPHVKFTQKRIWSGEYLRVIWVYCTPDQPRGKEQFVKWLLHHHVSSFTKWISASRLKNCWMCFIGFTFRV